MSRPNTTPSLPYQSTERFQRKLSLARLNTDLLVKWGVLEPPSHVHQHMTSGKPSLTGAVDTRVCDVAESDVATNVHVPGP